MTTAALAAPDTSTTADLTPDQISAENAATRAVTADNPNPEASADYTPPAPPPAQNDNTAEPPRTLSAREQIAERAKAARKANEAASEALVQNDMGEYVPPAFMPKPAEAEVEGEKPADEGSTEKDPPETAPAKTEGYKLKVRGNDIPVANRDELLRLAEVDAEEATDFTDAQLIKLAQKQLAASSFLEEAKGTAKQARTTARATGDTQPDTAVTDPENPTAKPAAPHQGTDLKAVIEAIQFGDPEEAAKKLQEAIDNRAHATVTHTQVERRVEEVESTVNQATRTFEAANADLVQDPDLATILYQRNLPAEFRKDLIGAGLDPSRVDAVLGTTVKDAMEAYVAVVADGRVKVRTPDQLLAAAAENVRTKFGRPAPSSPAPQPGTPAPAAPAATPSRQELKRGLLPQPSRASVPLPTAAARKGDTPEARSSVVAKMRATRVGQG
jgi:hypothetical protein